MVYPALLPLLRTPRLPVVDRADAPANLNGLVRFAERRKLVSARVPSHFNWPLRGDSKSTAYHKQQPGTKCEKFQVYAVSTETQAARPPSYCLLFGRSHRS